MAEHDAVVLELNSVTKTFGEHQALKGVSVTLNKGEMVALIGPSGSGKSTLLRVAAGLTLADTGAGSVRLFGEEHQSGGRLASGVRDRRRRLGFIFQQFNLVERLSLFKNALLGAQGRLSGWKAAFGVYPKTDQELAMRALHRVGIAQNAAQRASNLSGGQKQRGAIARALVQGSEMIFADEPIASLDPVSAKQAMELLKDLNAQEGLTVLVTLHQVDYATKFCDRAIALKAGEVVYDGPAAGLDRDTLINIYGDEYAKVSMDGELKPELRPAEEKLPMEQVTTPLWRALLPPAVLAAAVAAFAGVSMLRTSIDADIKFSILSTENAQNLRQMWDPFLADMAEQTGLTIEPFFGSNYNALVQALRFDQTQVGWFSNKSGLEAVRRAESEVFMRSSDPSGVDGYQSILIVKQDSALTLEDVLRCDGSLDFGLGDANSTSGTLAPITFLFAPQDINLDACFRTVRNANHEANLRAVAAGQIPVATNNDTNLRRMARQDPAVAEGVRIIWTSPTIPEDPILWRSDLDPAIKEKIGDFFYNYGRQGDAEQQAREREILRNLDFGVFMPADNRHLLPVCQMDAARALLDAQQTGNARDVDTAREHLIAVRTQRDAYEADPEAGDFTPCLTF